MESNQNGFENAENQQWPGRLQLEYMDKPSLEAIVEGARVQTWNRKHQMDERMEEELSAVHLRLVGVSIEHLSWEDFIARYDKQGMTSPGLYFIAIRLITRRRFMPTT